jgi:hypothetical protein
MTNSPDHYGGYGSAYGGYPFAAAEPEGAVHRAQALWMAAAVLGLATFGISFGSPVAPGWAMWFSVLAAVVAGIGLLPGQGEHGWLAATFAVTGFLVALSTWVKADGAGWAIAVMVVLNLLQAAVAVAALMLGGERQAGQAGPDYAAYTQYVQAYQAYAQYQQAPPAQQRSAGQGQAAAQAHSTATAQVRGHAGARADSAQESYEALQQRYQQQAAYPPAPPQRGAAGGAAAAAGLDPGIPSYGRGGPSAAQQPGARPEEQGEASSN